MTPSENYAQKRQDAENLIRKYAPEHLHEQLTALLRPAIALTATPASDEQIPLGASKFGGAPDVPSDFEWPLWNETPLAFLAQIDLEEVAPFDVEGLLPKSGLLSFFLSINEHNRVWGEPEQHQGWQVLFCHEPLQRVEPPAGSQWIVPVLTQSVSCDWGWSLEEDLSDDFDWEEDEWSDFQWEVLEKPPYRMLGCAYAPQLSPLVIAANGSQGRGGKALYEEGVSTAEWGLLLQLDTIANGFFDGEDDLGWFYFMIHREDLKNANFSRTWFHCQST